MSDTPLFELPGSAAPLLGEAFRWPTSLADPAFVAALPDEHCLGVLDMTQTLWRLKVGPGRVPARTVLADDYVPQASGGVFIPVSVANPDMFVYLQSRRIIRIDPTSGDARQVSFTGELDELPIRASFVTRDPPVLAVESHDTSEFLRSRLGVRLRTFELTTTNRPCGELRRGVPTDCACPLTWDAGAGLVVVLDAEGSAVYDATLRLQVDHPLRTHLAGLAGQGCRLFDIRVHPTGSWALLAGERGGDSAGVGLWSVRWGGSAAPVWLIRGPRGASIEIVGLSPDGMWVAYWASGGRDIGLYVQRVFPAASRPYLLLADAPGDVQVVWLIGPPALALLSRGAAEFSVWWLDGRSVELR